MNIRKIVQRRIRVGVVVRLTGANGPGDEDCARRDPLEVDRSPLRELLQDVRRVVQVAAVSSTRSGMSKFAYTSWTSSFGTGEPMVPP